MGVCICVRVDGIEIREVKGKFTILLFTELSLGNIFVKLKFWRSSLCRCSQEVQSGDGGSMRSQRSEQICRGSKSLTNAGRNNGYINGVVPLRSPSTVSEIDEFCFVLGGKKPIHIILIANNGMAAVKLSGLYMSAGICGDHNHPTGLNVALAFDMDYARWLEEHQRLVNDLRSMVNSQLGDAELRILVDGIMSHYDEIFRLKGGFHSSELLKVINQQLMDDNGDFLVMVAGGGSCWWFGHGVEVDQMCDINKD
ncbi:hypothetical protein POM88_002686 [Heracleum sosnowskyi]|uniref:DOG1 domain-containing protein n=1 Tax=Heracleum sosnowskyi TaxID=360622 RepID=A0AAD8NC78_9APIA|nr:hypothetical protein POM88_002686 [Heracleum sosnowskyi]